MSSLASLLVTLLYLSVPSYSYPSRSQEPAIASNFPDPAFIQHNNIYYAFSTNSNGLNVPIATSTNFTIWHVTGEDAMPHLPPWTTGNIWAPSVMQLVSLTHVERAYFEDVPDPPRQAATSFSTSPAPATTRTSTASGPPPRAPSQAPIPPLKTLSSAR